MAARDDMFKEWQELRKQDAEVMRNLILEWAGTHAPDTMTLAAVRGLQERAENFMSVHSRRVFDRVSSGIKALT